MDARNIRSIVVASDLTEGSDRVVRAAAAIAGAAGADLHVLHVHVVPAAAYAEWLVKSAPSPSAAVDAAERALGEQVDQAQAHAAAIGRAVVTSPSASEAIRRHVHKVGADLVVLGPHRAPATDRPYLGTTADRLIRTAGVPCLVVRGSLDLPLRRIGVLTDFSPAAKAAQDTAAAWLGPISGGEATASGPAEGAQLLVAHIAFPANETERDEAEDARLRRDIERSIERSVGRAAVGRDIDYRSQVLWDRDPADAVARWVRAGGIQLVVLGTEGVSRLPYLYLGNLASTVARTAPCSVLLVPPGYVPVSARAAGESEMRVGRVVTGVDFFEDSWRAALWAMRYFAPDASHELVHVVAGSGLPAPLGQLEADVERIRRATRTGAERQLTELAELGVCPDVTTHVVEGAPGAEIVRLAEGSGADLVVVGERGRDRDGPVLLGSTAERVLVESRVPVLVSRRVGETPPQRLLVAIHPSQACESLLAWTRSLISRFNAAATVVCVVDGELLSDPSSGVPPEQDMQSLATSAREAMEAWLEGRIRDAGLPPSHLSEVVLVGDPGHEIVAEAARREADLVLVGGEAAGIAHSPLLGQVVNKVVRAAPCSVLVVRPGGPHPPERS